MELVTIVVIGTMCGWLVSLCDNSLEMELVQIMVIGEFAWLCKKLTKLAHSNISTQVCVYLVSVGAADPSRHVRSGVPRIHGVTSEPARILNHVNQRNEDGSYTYGFQVR